ncbi:MAG TPA: AAA family ATPase [Candidatus Limnocylindrales bacterium]|nr:AAA family ATPase [Candidatus Limnocylindrales bacterium]
MLGRAREVAAIARFTSRVGREPVGLLVEGEPGIGKTTVLSEAMHQARQRGHRVLQARPAESEADLSFAALGDLVGEVFNEASGVLPAPQRQALEVALLLREADEPADPRTTASALLSVMTTVSRRAPLVIVIDDAQWLDPASTRALEFTVRRLPATVGVVVGRRVGAAGPLDLASALPPGGLEHVALGPLPMAAVHRLVRARSGVSLPRPLLNRIAEASGGNPFFALEISDAIARGGTTLALGDALPVPARLQDLLSDRIDRLSPEGRAVASGAAALSRPTDEMVRAAVGPDVDVDAALVEAENAGVLVSDRDRVRFSHPLLASAIYGSLNTAERRSLHRRLAALVVDPEERGRHLARSVTTADVGVASTVEEGADLAARRGATEAAAELYEAACRLTPPERSGDLARRMLAGANALASAGDITGAQSLATRALAIGPTADLRARVLVLLGSIASYTETMDVRVALHEQALAEAGEDASLRARVLLALFEQIASDAPRAGQRADEAIALLGRDGDMSERAQALICKFIAEAVIGHGPRTDLLDQALALEAGSGGPLSTYPLIWFHWIDDLEATRARFRLHDQRYRDLGDVVGTAEIVEFVAMAEFRAGHWAEAERSLEAACETLAHFELRGPLVASFTDRSIIDAHRGRIDRARLTVDRILGIEGLDVFWRMVCHSAQGSVEFCDGAYAAADEAWTTMRAEAEVVGWADFLDDRSEPDHVEVLVALGRLDEARSVLDHLEWRGRTLPRSWIDASLPRARALILAAEGSVPNALSVIDEARAIASLPFESARLLLVRGQLERRANRKLAAKASLTAALAAFSELGSPPWERRARDQIARLGLRHRGPHELTEGERRIAELAAMGLTNREVANAAFVSPKTVEANLARVYQKLGIRSRAELGARMSASSSGSETQP